MWFCLQDGNEMACSKDFFKLYCIIVYYCLILYYYAHYCFMFYLTFIDLPCPATAAAS